MATIIRVMDIPTLLRDVQKAKGYKSVEDMAFNESVRLGTRVPIATLRSWMTANPRYHRQPLTVASLQMISRITGRSLAELVEAFEPGDVRTAG